MDPLSVIMATQINNDDRTRSNISNANRSGSPSSAAASSLSSQEDDFIFKQGAIFSTKHPLAVPTSNYSRGTQINNDNSNDKENDNSMPPPRSIKNRKRSASSSSSSSLLSQSRRQKENVEEVAQTGKSSKKKKSTFLSIYVDNNKAREENQGTHKEDAGREISNSRVDDIKHQYFGSDKAAVPLDGINGGGGDASCSCFCWIERPLSDELRYSEEMTTASLCNERLDTMVEGVTGNDPQEGQEDTHAVLYTSYEEIARSMWWSLRWRIQEIADAKSMPPPPNHPPKK